MFTVDPNTLYPLSDLRDSLEGMVTLETLLEKLDLKHGRMFRDAVWGFEILGAAKKASGEWDRKEEGVENIFSRTNSKSGRRTPSSKSQEAAGPLSVKDL